MIDTHCHIDQCKAASEEVVARARAVGVRHMATVGMESKSIAAALALAEQHDEVVAIVGRHPNEASRFDEAALAEIEIAAAHSRARAIGETGLDYYRDLAPRSDQRAAFEAQADLARALELPLVIHTRAAEADTFAILEERAEGLTVILHCFSAPDWLDHCVDHGYICSFAGNLTYPSAKELQAAARGVPDDLLLVETDSPYLSPQTVRREPNEPANVSLTAEFLAELRGVSYVELEATVERNAARVFCW